MADISVWGLVFDRPQWPEPHTSGGLNSDRKCPPSTYFKPKMVLGGGGVRLRELSTLGSSICVETPITLTPDTVAHCTDEQTQDPGPRCTPAPSTQRSSALVSGLTGPV